VAIVHSLISPIDTHKLPRRGVRKGNNMKYLFAAVLVAGTVAGLGGASAEDGCGRGWHRNPYGECRPNRGVVVAPGAVVVERPVVVTPGVVVETPVVRRCPVGFAWRYGACRPI
jgi:hypothetical protein